MKLLRIGEPGFEKPAALIDDGHYIDLSDVVTDFDEDFFGTDGLVRIASTVAERGATCAQPFAGQRIGSPIARPHQIVCVGLNYTDHALETGQAIPDEPILFTKAPNSIVGPNDSVIVPRGATKLDWEVELGVVISARTSYLSSPEDARHSIAGWAVVNDISERSFQLERGGQWVKGKSAETFNPIGPYLVTADDVEDVCSLDMWLDVNGQRRQTGSTASMIFDPYYLVYYISQFMVLEPGDLINTGTPPGVGMGQEPQLWLADGDVMTLGISGLGQQRQIVVGREES